MEVSLDSNYVDDCKINIFIKLFHVAVESKSMEDFYSLFNLFSELNNEERDSVFLNIIFYIYIKDKA